MFFFSKMIDRTERRLYKPAPFLMMLAAVMLSGTAAMAQAVDTGHAGVVLPNWSRKIGPNRYRAPGQYADTLKFFDKQYASNPRKPIVNQPGLRGVHIVNRGPGSWAGLNVYEVGQETRIYIVPRSSERQ